MVAVNYDLLFTYVFAGWEGSAHDATVLADALLGKIGSLCQKVIAQNTMKIPLPNQCHTLS